MVIMKQSACFKGDQTERETGRFRDNAFYFDSDSSSSPSKFNKLVIDLDRCCESDKPTDTSDGCDRKCSIPYTFLSNETLSLVKIPAVSDDDGIYSADTDVPSDQLTAVNDDRDFSPASPEDCDSSPASPEDCDSSPASPEDCDSSPASPEDCDSSPASPEDCDSSPASPEDCDFSPASPEDCDFSPASPDDCVFIPASPDDCDFSPASPDECVDKNDAACYSEEYLCDPSSPVEVRESNLYDDLFDPINHDETCNETEKDNQSMLYDDLLCKEYLDQKEHVKDLQEKYHLMLNQNKTLTERVEKMSADLLIVQKKNSILIRNISSLYQTAKLEIERKNNDIDNLRRDLDNLLFRRNGNIKPNPVKNNQTNFNSGSFAINHNKNDIVIKREGTFKPNKRKFENTCSNDDQTSSVKGISKQMSGKSVASSADFVRVQNYFTKGKVPVTRNEIAPAQGEYVPPYNQQDAANSSIRSKKLLAGDNDSCSSIPSKTCLKSDTWYNKSSASVNENISKKKSVTSNSDRKSDTANHRDFKEKLSKSPKDKPHSNSDPRSPRRINNSPKSRSIEGHRNHKRSPDKKTYSVACRSSPRKKLFSVPDIKDVGKHDNNRKAWESCRTSPRKKLNGTRASDVKSHGSLKCNSDRSPPKRGHGVTACKTSPKKNSSTRSNEHGSSARVTPKKRDKSGKNKAHNKEIPGSASERTSKKNSRKRDALDKKVPRTEREALDKKLISSSIRTSPRKRSSTHDVHRKLFKTECQLSPQKKRAKLSQSNEMKEN